MAGSKLILFHSIALAFSAFLLNSKDGLGATSNEVAPEYSLLHCDELLELEEAMLGMSQISRLHHKVVLVLLFRFGTQGSRGPDNV